MLAETAAQDPTTTSMSYVAATASVVSVFLSGTSEIYLYLDILDNKIFCELGSSLPYRYF